MFASPIEIKPCLALCSELAAEANLLFHPWLFDQLPGALKEILSSLSFGLFGISLGERCTFKVWNHCFRRPYRNEAEADVEARYRQENCSWRCLATKIGSPGSQQIAKLNTFGSWKSLLVILWISWLSGKVWNKQTLQRMVQQTFVLLKWLDACSTESYLFLAFRWPSLAIRDYFLRPRHQIAWAPGVRMMESGGSAARGCWRAFDTFCRMFGWRTVSLCFWIYKGWMYHRPGQGLHVYGSRRGSFPSGPSQAHFAGFMATLFRNTFSSLLFLISIFFMVLRSSAIDFFFEFPQCGSPRRLVCSFWSLCVPTGQEMVKLFVRACDQEQPGFFGSP